MFQLVFFLIFEVPSMILMWLHKVIVADIRNEFWEPLNVWAYRIPGALILMTIVVVLVNVNTSTT